MTFFFDDVWPATMRYFFFLGQEFPRSVLDLSGFLTAPVDLEVLSLPNRTGSRTFTPDGPNHPPCAVLQQLDHPTDDPGLANSFDHLIVASLPHHNDIFRPLRSVNSARFAVNSPSPRRLYRVCRFRSLTLRTAGFAGLLTDHCWASRLVWWNFGRLRWLLAIRTVVLGR